MAAKKKSGRKTATGTRRVSAKAKKSAPKAARREPATRGKKSGRTSMSHGAMMKLWQKAMTPAEGHRRLSPLVGSWNTTTTFTMAPGAPASVSEGTSEHTWVLGGRYLRQVFAGTSMGLPFEGIGYTGYDNVQRKYLGTWMDSFGTGLMNSVGIGKPRKDQMDFEAEAVEPSGKRMAFWCRLRIQDHDHHTYEMWTEAPGGKRFRMMLVEYSRQ